MEITDICGFGLCVSSIVECICGVPKSYVSGGLGKFFHSLVDMISDLIMG